MRAAHKSYLLPQMEGQQLRPANDSGGAWVGMLPFSRLPFLLGLMGLLFLSPLVLVDSGFSLYRAGSGKAEMAPPRQMDVSLGGIGIAVPPSLQRVARVEEGRATFLLERIGRHLVPASADGEVLTGNEQVIHLSSGKARPSPRTILHSLHALHQPVLVERRGNDLAIYQLASGPITKARELVVESRENEEAAQDRAPFFALCTADADGTGDFCSAYLDAQNVFIEVEFSPRALEDWRLVESSARAFAIMLKEKGADPAL